MTRALSTRLARLVVAVIAVATPQPAVAAELCVGAQGCHLTIQAAVDAAQDGDTIRVGPGTYAGGITMRKNIDLVGAGCGATTIAGGGPVITVGEFFGPDQPTVSISRVTITGGFNDSKPDSFVAAGGGVWIPQAAGNATGATVAISDRVIAGNRVHRPKTGRFRSGGHPVRVRQRRRHLQLGDADGNGLANHRQRRRFNARGIRRPPASQPEVAIANHPRGPRLRR